MPKFLKEEISRLSRKEARRLTASVAKSNASLRSTVAELRKEVSGLKAEQKRLSSALSQLAQNAGVEPPKEEFRMTSRDVLALRRKLRLTQAQFATLLGVSTGAVFKRESKGGPAEVSRWERGSTAGRSNYRCCGSTRAVSDKGPPDQNK